MTPEIKAEYEQFFHNTAAGEYFLREMNRLIDENHKNAESKPELARDHTQRAKGNREALDHITSMTTEVKKKGMKVRV